MSHALRPELVSGLPSWRAAKWRRPISNLMGSDAWPSRKQAYVQFAHALKLESNNVAALKGRQACRSQLKPQGLQ